MNDPKPGLLAYYRFVIAAACLAWAKHAATQIFLAVLGGVITAGVTWAIGDQDAPTWKSYVAAVLSVIGICVLELLWQIVKLPPAMHGALTLSLTEKSTARVSQTHALLELKRAGEAIIFSLRHEPMTRGRWQIMHETVSKWREAVTYACVDMQGLSMVNIDPLGKDALIEHMTAILRRIEDKMR